VSPWGYRRLHDAKCATSQNFGLLNPWRRHVDFLVPVGARLVNQEVGFEGHSMRLASLGDYREGELLHGAIIAKALAKKHINWWIGREEGS
jgi:hypothetical protein